METENRRREGTMTEQMGPWGKGLGHLKDL